MKTRQIIILSALVLLIPFSIVSATQIPEWVKGVASFWVEGNISDEEFGKAISFLIENDIIQVEIPDSKADKIVEQPTGPLLSQIDSLQLEISSLESEIDDLKSENSNLRSEIANLESKSSSNSYSSSSSYSPSKELAIDLTGQDVISRGSTQSMTVIVTDDSGSVSGASIDVKVVYASGSTTKDFGGMTDSSGEYSFSWTIGGNSSPGTFKVFVDASKSGYSSASESFTFTVTEAN